ncbi:MAG TPA: DUF1549 and DUF1553 domain-containing protein [Pirellulales bacterium]
MARPESTVERMRISVVALFLPCALFVGLFYGQVGIVAAEDVSFRRDVMAVLSKAGCNQGVCHGNQNGKGGFKLSLRGQDPQFDLTAITRDQEGRRIDGLEPDQSLLLLKPTMRVAHEGGGRFAIDSPEYALLRSWLAEGARDDATTAPSLVRLEVAPAEVVLIEPRDEVQVRVTAHFADGTSRDVTSLAVYDPVERMATVDHNGRVSRQAFGETTLLVRYLERQVAVPLAFVPERANFAAHELPATNFVDTLVWANLRRLHMAPSNVCDDSTFLRRVYLDLLNVLPAADEARAFVANASAGKRAELVDRLLARPEFARAWALKWSDLLRNEEKTLDRKGVQAFHHWIERSIAEGKPLDQFARELIAARGSTYQNPPANFYRALRDPHSRGEAAAQVFLGVRLQCAKCHNHPFEHWTQDDYYDWASLFARVQYKVLSNQRLDQNDSHEFDGEQLVWIDRVSEVTNPRIDAPATPRVLGDTVGLPATEDQDRLQSLAEWIAGPVNKFFARAQVNRIWFHLLGRGIVEPIDDFRDTNPPTNPPLLEALAADFVEHGCDLRHSIRTVVNSRVYQLASTPNESNVDDDRNFSHAAVRRLSAEQLLDAVHQVAGLPPKFNGYPAGVRAGEVPGVLAVRPRDEPPSMDDHFLTVFGKPPRLLSCECERSTGTTLGQAFQMISGPLVNDLFARDEGRVSQLAGSGRPAGEQVEELYWTALSRPPTAEELVTTVHYVEHATDHRQALEDIAWGLVNAKEFVLRK